MRELRIRLKSGKELNMFCEGYTVETSKLNGELIGFNYKNAHGEVPLYVSMRDVECITAIISQESEEE